MMPIGDEGVHRRERLLQRLHLVRFNPPDGVTNRVNRDEVEDRTAALTARQLIDGRVGRYAETRVPSEHGGRRCDACGRLLCLLQVPFVLLDDARLLLPSE